MAECVRGESCWLSELCARHCVIEGKAGGEPQEMTDEMMAAVGRLMRRG